MTLQMYQEHRIGTATRLNTHTTAQQEMQTEHRQPAAVEDTNGAALACRITTAGQMSYCVGRVSFPTSCENHLLRLLSWRGLYNNMSK